MRNKIIKYANNDWVFFLDSDEQFQKTISQVEFHNLLALINTFIPHQNVTVYIESKFPESTEFYFPARIMRKNDSIEFFGKVHEDVRSKNIDTQLVKVLTKLQVINFGMLETEVDKFEKLSRYKNLVFEMIANEPDNPRLVALINPASLEDGIFNENYSILLKKSIFLDENKSMSTENIKNSPFLPTLLSRYIHLQILKGEIEEAKKAIRVGRKLYPNHYLILFSEYHLKKVEIDKQLKDLLNDLLIEMETIDEEDARNVSLMNGDIINGLVVKLLIGTEEYELAKLVSEGITDKNTKELIKNEFNLLKNLE